jgi:ubiquinol-cytochrome c reductase cytochrome b subunit
VSGIWNWFTQRWPFYPIKKLLLDEEIPGRARFAYTLGTGILTIIGLQIVSGIVQLFYYVPTVDHAYDSVSYLRTEVPFGWLFHNMHYWGANLMVVLVALHMVRVYIWGAYKTQLAWLIGVGLLIMTMALTFTGAPLIWDQRGYWAGAVGSSITGTVPLAGGIMKTILRGGESMGQMALSRFFIIHVGLLIPFLMLLIGMHIAAFRTTGVVGPWDTQKRKTSGPFWPDQAFRDMIVATVLIFIVITLCVFSPPEFTGPADPSNTTYLPKPEWNFLFLYQSLKYFKRPLEPIGTAGVPTVLLALLVFLPFIDRKPERNPLLRPIAMICLAVYAGTILTLTVIGYLSPGYAEMPAVAEKSSQGMPHQSAPVQAKPAVTKPALAGQPEQKKENGQKEQETDAASSGKLPGQAAFVIGSAENGALLFKKHCSGCHGQQGTGGLPNPGSDEGKVPTLNPADEDLLNPDPQIFARNVDIFIQHGSVPPGPRPVIKMPPFGDSHALTQQEIANIEAYILGLNSVDRIRPLHPGMQPFNFFIVTACMFGITALVLGGIWNKKFRCRE